MRINPDNEKIKRRYLNRLREVRGLSEASIVSMERAICKYDEFSNSEDYRKFSQVKATAFKKWLRERKQRDKPVCASTYCHDLRYVKDFFAWLSGEPGFRSKITLDAVSYLSPDKQTVREATEPILVEFPTLEQVKELVNSIQPLDEIGMRDRALISFLLSSGMRDLAVATLPLGCFDAESLEVMQIPRKGIKTKFRKSFISSLMPFDKSLVEIIVAWHRYLISERLFTVSQPMFPRTQLLQGDGGLSYSASGVEPVFWATTGPIRQILKKRATESGLPYFKPHAFRHAAIHLAMRSCRTPEETRAMSQNFGHEKIGTTLMTYGKLDQRRALEVIGKIDFTEASSSEFTESELEAIESILRKARKRT